MVNQIEEIVALFDEIYIINEPTIQQVKGNEKPVKINFEGGNNAPLIFVFEAKLNEADAKLIYNLIHNAMKTNMQSVMFVYLADNIELSEQQLINIMNPKQLVIWGCPAWFPSIENYKVEKVQSTKLLHVDAVNLFHTDVKLKTILWNSIQEIIK